MAVMFTGLARVAKKTGYPVEEVEGWETTGHGGMTSCKTIVIHHTAGADNGKDYNSYNTVKNGRPGLPGPLSQYGIGRNTGKVIVFAAGRSWHAGTVGKSAHGNRNAIGIEIENNGVGEDYSDNAYNSAVALAGELVQEFKLSVDDVLGHKEIAVPKGRKIDPSFSMGKFRDDVRSYISGGKGDVKPTVTKPAPAKAPAKPKATAKDWPAGLLLVDGHFGNVSVTALQLMLKDHPVASVRYRGLIDGGFGKMTRSSVQRWLAWLGKYNGRIDGDFGPMTVKALQTFLKDDGTLDSGKWRTDGLFHKQTKMAFQRYINSQAEHYRK